jgi:hypothetical protein
MNPKAEFMEWVREAHPTGKAVLARCDFCQRAVEAAARDR